MATSSRDIDLLPREGEDSRGRPTVEVELQLGSVRAVGDVPGGETRGDDEAQTVPVPQAIANLREVILPLLREAEADVFQHTGLLELERRLIARAGPNCSDLGANAVLPEIKKRGVLVVGGDFYVTQRRRLEKGIAAGSANGLLVKPNQNGDLHGTFEVMKLARRHGIELVISHRSGETLDDSIADIAIAVGAFGIKTGAPQPEVDFPDRSRWVRRVKYLRMIQIEEREGVRLSRP